MSVPTWTVSVQAWTVSVPEMDSDYSGMDGMDDAPYNTVLLSTKG